MDPVPCYNELATAFGCEPSPQRFDYLDVPIDANWRELWPYTSVSFSAVQAGIGVDMSVEPAYRIVRLRLTMVGTTLLDLDLQGVRTVGTERVNGRHLVWLDFDDDLPATMLWLRLKPDTTIQWTVGAAL